MPIPVSHGFPHSSRQPHEAQARGGRMQPVTSSTMIVLNAIHVHVINMHDQPRPAHCDLNASQPFKACPQLYVSDAASCGSLRYHIYEPHLSGQPPWGSSHTQLCESCRSSSNENSLGVGGTDEPTRRKWRNLPHISNLRSQHCAGCPARARRLRLLQRSQIPLRLFVCVSSLSQRRRVQRPCSHSRNR